MTTLHDALSAHMAECAKLASDSSLRSAWSLLVSVAAGTFGRGELTTENTYDSVSVAFDEVAQALGDVWGDCWPDMLPVDLIEVTRRVEYWLHADDLITISQAAHILRGDAQKRDLMAVHGLTQRGKLRVFFDPHEPNPTRARRVLESQVLILAGQLPPAK